MEKRMAKFRQVSPERAKVWTEKPSKYVQNRRKVPVVYYLCRNRQLEHPHFIEVSLSSPEGLYLRDVFEKLSVLRGRGMASMYSWACKRSYKNGFVWHDLCEDDLIVPARGNEYVLKGSEIIAESNSGHLSPDATLRNQNVKQLPEPPSSMSGGDASSSSSMNAKETKHRREDDISPLSRFSGCSGVSLDSRVGISSSWGGSLTLSEYRGYKNEGVVNASTQTEESTRRRTKLKNSCTQGVSTEEGLIDAKCAQICSSLSPLSTSSAPSSGGKPHTLESLIRIDANRINSFRILEREDVRIPPNRKLKASDMLMQLISCGSVSVKDHSFGLVPTYRPQFSHLKFPSPVYSTSVMLGELDCLPGNPRLVRLRLEDKEYFSGSVIETQMFKERDDHVSLKRSSSFNVDRQHELNTDEEATSSRSKCLPLSLQASGSNHPMRSPISDKSRSLYGGLDEQDIIAHDVSNGNSKRSNSLEYKLSKGHDSFREDRDNIIKIEERLTSGARVIIQSKET